MKQLFFNSLFTDLMIAISYTTSSKSLTIVCIYAYTHVHVHVYTVQYKMSIHALPFRDSITQLFQVGRVTSEEVLSQSHLCSTERSKEVTKRLS